MTKPLTSKQIDALAIKYPFAAHPEIYARHKRLEGKMADHIHKNTKDIQVQSFQGGGKVADVDYDKVREIIRDNPGISIARVAWKMKRCRHVASAALSELVNSGDALVGSEMHENGRSRYAAYYLKVDV